jgi:hypothetical protein
VSSPLSLAGGAARLAGRCAGAARCWRSCSLLEGVTAERFAADLDAEEQWILLFARAGRELVGFSTVRIGEDGSGAARGLVYSATP